MPIEIRELVIRATTEPDAKNSAAKAASGLSNLDQAAIVQECVRQIMSILKKKEDR